jgi:hypothetical protein
MRLYLTSAATAFAAIAAFSIASAAPSAALTAQECSAKYNAAKTAGTLGDTKWNDFRKAQCSDDAKAAEATKPVEKPAEKMADKPADKPAMKAATTAAPAAIPSGTVFPKVVDAKYAKESAGKARMHTCRDQYQANKTGNGNGGMKWIMKGGGYYSLCNKSLKS